MMMSFLYLLLANVIISCDVIVVDGYSPALAPHITYASKISHINVDVDVLQFWGKQRNTQEIVDHVSNAVFSNHQRSDQWVEVISAEPPVRLSDSYLLCNTLCY